MNQEKIGKFIAVCRKERGLTQVQLAEKLGVTDRAVSKWENAKSMPDSSIMLPLCEILGINVNELLTGEKIAMKDYDRHAEENLIRLKKENEEQKKWLLTMDRQPGAVHKCHTHRPPDLKFCLVCAVTTISSRSVPPTYTGITISPDCPEKFFSASATAVPIPEAIPAESPSA